MEEGEGDGEEFDAVLSTVKTRERKNNPVEVEKLIYSHARF